MDTPSNPTERSPEDQQPAPEEAREPLPEETAGPEEASAEERQPGAFARGARTVLGNETRLGRFMRAALRILAAVVGLFALGLLAAYLLLYRPAQQQLTQTRADLNQTRQQLETAQTELDQTRRDLSTVQAQNEDLTTQLEAANAHVLLLQAHEDVNLARLELADKNPSAARQALGGTQDILDRIAPTLNTASPNLAETLKTRLDLALGEMAKDPEIASADLTIISDRLTEAEESLFREE